MTLLQSGAGRLRKNNLKYSHNAKYFWFNSGDKNESYFLRRDGYRIRTDEVVGLVWRQADGKEFS